MNQTTKTIAFVAAAAIACVGAMFGKQSPIGIPPNAQIGTALFPDFEDPFDAKSLEVVEFDEDLGRTDSFQVAQKQGQWVIPSHEDYPADAEDNLKESAIILVGLEIIHVASDRRQDHELYGVIKPDTEEVEMGDRGVGKLIVMKDAKGKGLAELVIGKQVRDNEDQRFVRRPGTDRVYVVKIDPDKVSIDFEDWIEADLLDLNGFDIEQMVIRDYSVNAGFGGQGLTLEYDPRLDMTVNWNADDFKWELEELQEFRGGEMRPTEPLASEEIDKTPLDGMKTALDDLKIVDVRRKPAGLREDLKTDEGFLNNRESIQSLFDKGFYPYGGDGGELDIMSSDGEVLVRTKDGVEYLLRFGQIAGVDQSDDSEESTLNRYVMVTTSLHKASFSQPELEQIPEVPVDEGDESDEESVEETSDESDESEAPAGDAEGDPEEAGTEAADADGSEDEDAVDIESERERIVKENQRKMDEYNERLEKAEDVVQELNSRFAEWYYIIPEDVYKKVHLSRNDVFKEKEVDESERVDLESFRELELDGLSREAAEE